MERLARRHLPLPIREPEAEGADAAAGVDPYGVAGADPPVSEDMGGGGGGAATGFR
jgi:hypothetical protein